MHPTFVDSVWLRRYGALVVCSTFALVVAGGLVTSNDAALAIPDWPLNWGRLIPPLEANIRYEFAHRVLALITALLTAGLAVKLRTRLAWTALAAVLVQAGLGGVLVKYIDPAWAAVVHAALAQLFFGIAVALLGQVSDLPRAPAPLIAAVALFAQTVLGAAVRHHIASPIPHIFGAAVATILVMWAGLSTLMTHMDDPALRRPALALLSLTFSQVFLGIAAYMARAATADAPQPMPLMVWITVAHVAVGSLAFGAAVVLAGQSAQPASLPQRTAAA
ncbi:MAG TPA: COX15/CtaA family protein [Verrucomicrobiae bacterium]|nr:COX15/CtaA family protein [Verrucomicrobiae bacterium]